MSTQKPVALFDLDGTLADFTWAMQRGLASLASPGEPEYSDEHENEPSYITARRRIIKRQPGFWSNLPKLRLGFDVLDVCVTLGYRINILTKAPKTNFPAWAEKAQWYSTNLGLDDYKVTMTEDKGIVYGRVLVDDWIPYVEPWLAHRPRGLVIMPAHSYNEGFTHPNVIRYDGKNFKQVLEGLRQQLNHIDEQR